MFPGNRRKGATILSIKHHSISQIDGRIYGVAAYYSKNDATQHVVVATHNGTLYEIHWKGGTGFSSPQPFTAHFPDINSLCGFFTSDVTHQQHVVVATNNGQLNELYSPNLLTARPGLLPPNTGSSAGLHIGM